MSDGLSLLLRTLDGLAAPVTCFIRDDDAGWDDNRQLALLDATARAGVPIDLAVIPLALGRPLATALNARIDAAPHLLGVHQHGLAHTNHQAEGRSCEFGPARDAAAQRADLLQGRERLRTLLGHRLDPFFTPPWNRCAPHTPGLLAELGFVALSRDRGATPQAELPELPVDLDWCKHHRAGGPLAAAQTVAALLSARAADGRPFGWMLHHAAMAEAEFTLLSRWFTALAAHPRLRWRSMRSLLADTLAPATTHHAAQPAPATTP
jgi:hypothetical protein